MQRNSNSFIIFFLFLFLFLSPAHAQTVFGRKLTIGGQYAGGNTRLNSLHFEYYLNRNRKLTDELTTKGSLDYESNDGVDTVFKAYTFLRYAYSMGDDLYHFYKLEMEHDRFQDVDLRLIPTIGIGYWFRNDDTFRFTIEGAIGYQRNYLLNSVADEMVVLKLSTFFMLWAFSNDFDVFVDTADLNNFRFVNEMTYKIKLNTHYAFKWMFKNEFNNRPAAGIQKNDLRTTLGLEYAFKKTVE
ncbi:MAG: DUF481 domain-containing protein [Candidatus Margulisiibacteriota bacterium]|nr:DUF481 domain-containing protein [Candidatus Margulisiibacteriota bacterium]